MSNALYAISPFDIVIITVLMHRSLGDLIDIVCICMKFGKQRERTSFSFYMCHYALTLVKGSTENIVMTNVRE